MRVPQSIKDHYNRPLTPPLPPTGFLDPFGIPVERQFPIIEGGDRPQSTAKSLHPPEITDAQELWLQSVIKLQSEAALLLERHKVSQSAPVRAQPNPSLEVSGSESSSSMSNFECEDLEVSKLINHQPRTLHNLAREALDGKVDNKLETSQLCVPRRTPDVETSIRMLKRRNSDPVYSSSPKVVKIEQNGFHDMPNGKDYKGCNGFHESVDNGVSDLKETLPRQPTVTSSPPNSKGLVNSLGL